MSHCTLTFTHLTFFPLESLISGRGQGSKYADAWLQIWRVEILLKFISLGKSPLLIGCIKQFYPNSQWFAMRMYSESPGPSGCNVGYAAPSYVASARICQLLNGFFLAGSFCVMEWGKQFCFLFATLLCEFVLLFRAFLYLFHGGWFVQFNFSVFL